MRAMPPLLAFCSSAVLLLHLALPLAADQTPAMAHVTQPNFKPALRVLGHGSTPPKAESSPVALAVSIAKNTVGAGVFLLPTGAVQVGVIPALVLMLVAGVLSAFFFYVLGRAAAQTSSHKQRELWERTIGPKSAWIADATVVTMALGSCVQFMSTIISLITQLAEANGRAHIVEHATTRFFRSRLGCVASVVSLLLPFCLCSSLNALRHFSWFGLCGAISGVFFVLLRAIDGSYGPGGRFYEAPSVAIPPLVWGWRGGSAWLPFIGMLNTAFLAHLNVPRYWTELKSQSLDDFGTVCAASFGGNMVLYALVMVGGAVTFGGRCDKNLVLHHYSSADVGVQLTRLATLVSVGGGFPLSFLALKESCTMLLARAAEPAPTQASHTGDGTGASMSSATQAGAAWERRFGLGVVAERLTGQLLGSERRLSLLLLTIISFITYFASNLGLVFSLRGALLGAWLVFGIPALVLIHSSRAQRVNSRFVVRACHVVVAFAAVNSVVGPIACILQAYGKL